MLEWLRPSQSAQSKRANFLSVNHSRGVTGRRASLQPAHEPTTQVNHVIKIATKVPKLDIALVTGNLEEVIILPPHNDP